MACVYILTNETIPGLLKIGFTGGTAAERDAEISRGTGVPSPYTVHWFMETTTTSAAYEVEQAVLTAQANALRYGTGAKKARLASSIGEIVANYQQSIADAQLQSQAATRANAACAYYDFMATK